MLKEHGITQAMVDIGDIVISDPDLRASGAGLSRFPMRVGKNAPPKMQLSNCAISSSGEYEQFVVIGGVRYSHVVEPRTGRALTSRVQSTVIARDGLTSDPLSTSFTLVSKARRTAMTRAFPGTTSYVRKLGR